MNSQSAEFFHGLLPDPPSLCLEQVELDREQRSLTLSVSSIQCLAPCPVCGVAAARVHSRYERTLADLPCVTFRLTLVVQVSKFFCDNPHCRRRIFTERLPRIAVPWARKTMRLTEWLSAIGLALGGAAGARLAAHLGCGVCGSTVLNQLQRLCLPPVETPKILGVDDFALRKGHTYGTILVDLERHQPIALLSDRKAETLAAWLREHPGVAVLSRDRSAIYRQGMTQGAPEAVQVADRFHLVENLGEALEKVLCHYRCELKAIEQQPGSPDAKTVVVPARSTVTRSEQDKSQTYQQRRVQQQQDIKTLRQQGWSQADIAQQVGVSLRTVQRFMSVPDFPAVSTQRSTLGSSLLDPYKQTILQWWNQGTRTTAVLMEHLQALGYEGGLRTLQRYISRLKLAQGVPQIRVKFPAPLPEVTDPQTPPFTPRQASYLILKRREHRDAQDTNLLTRLVFQHPDLATAVTLAEDFLQLLRQRQPEQLEPWINRALDCSLKPLQSFAQGLADDFAAVQASLRFEVSNGPVEGLNNRLKLLKRQMYGRAGLDLLSKRLILAA
jgi:transposase